MDIVYYRREDRDNGSGDSSVDPYVIGSDYIQKNPGVAVPYLSILILATLSGTVGNVMVIGAVITNKVGLECRSFLTIATDPFGVCKVLAVRRGLQNSKDEQQGATNTTFLNSWSDPTCKKICACKSAGSTDDATEIQASSKGTKT